MSPNAASKDTTMWTDLTRAQRALIAIDVAEPPPADDGAHWQSLIAKLQHGLPEGQQGQVLDRQAQRLLMSFEQSAHAVEAALLIQQASGGAATARFRVGLHAHEQQASELAGLAVPGEVLLSEALRDQIVAGLDAEIEELGETQLEGQSARLFRLQPCAEAVPTWGLFADKKPTLVMLPLRVLAGNRCDPVYAELISYGAMRGLSQNKAWHLISRLSSEAYRHRSPVAGELQRRLRASHVLSGSVSIDGKLLHAQLELMDAHSGERVWADRISHPFHMARAADNPFGRAIVEAVSHAVFGSVSGSGSLASLGDLDSYTLLFSAMALMHRVAGADFARSQVMLEHLVQRHPESCEPEAWLAKWHVMKVARGLSPDIDADSALARQHAERALQGSGDRALALAIDGVVQAFLLQDLDRAEAQLTAAIADNPNESLAWLFMSALYAYRDRGNAAADAAGMALMLSPLDPMRYYFDSFASHAMLAAGRLNEAIVLAGRSLRTNNRHLPTHRTLAIARVLNGQEAQGRESVAALRRLDPGYTLQRFETRYPGRGTPFAARCAEALRSAGLP